MTVTSVIGSIIHEITVMTVTSVFCRIAVIGAVGRER